MIRQPIRFLQALLLALFFATSIVLPTYAQRAPASEPAKLYMQSGWQGSGRLSRADSFVIVCPIQEVLDPSHPCSESNSASIQPASFDDYVLVCPNKEVLDPNHPCASRRAQIVKATADDFVLVCPTKEVLDPNHPCGQAASGAKQFKIARDFVMTCPVKEVLEPGHPCAE